MEAFAVRRAFALASLATLIKALALYVFNQEAIAEIVTDIACFAAIAAILVSPLSISKEDR